MLARSARSAVRRGAGTLTLAFAFVATAGAGPLPLFDDPHRPLDTFTATSTDPIGGNWK